MTDLPDSAPARVPSTAPEQPAVSAQALGHPADKPSRDNPALPMVGIGGSAGAIRALQAFFTAMSPTSGMAFVVVLHLSPDHASSLVEMIGKWTRMRVIEARDRAALEPNTVYVIPPAKQLKITDGFLEVADLRREPGRLMTVDHFFRSLADTHGAHAAAIVLSGADGDGVLGIKRMKERGGLTIAQDPTEAEHGAMPRAAIGTGMVDWVLPAAQMPQRLVEYVASGKRLVLPVEDETIPSPPTPAASPMESALREILVFLRTRTRSDFSCYKRATIVRRISRRMQVNGLAEMAEYLAFLRTHPGEAGALLKELLISVTNFFRDRDAFEALARHIPELYRDKTSTDTVRVWVPGCATGEEAYSLAMLCIEHAHLHNSPAGLQVFACDLDEEAVQTARSGLYPDAITADVSEERLRRFFVKEHGGYRVRRELREVVLFATHDLLKDAPFCRVDLLSCRNLLIYLNSEAQARALDIFHFALKPGGLLFLGAAESIDDGSALFHPLDKKCRIYARRASPRPFTPVTLGTAMTLSRNVTERLAAGEKKPDVSPAPPPATTAIVSATRAVAETRASVARKQEGTSWSELHFKLIERFGPPSVLIDRSYDIQHISESAGRFLHVVGGLPTTNLLQLVHPALRIELRAALFRSAQTGQVATALRIPVELDGKPCQVDLRVSPASDLAPDFSLVTFEARDSDVAPMAPVTTPPATPLPDLERELEHMKTQLRDTVEQYEASTEELKAGNEELQAMNEELRSATEELETSREELQSINEELSTVNLELKNKIDELAHANSDLQNLMSATLIATVFLDRDMRIMRFTNSATPIFNLIPSDIGRPLSDLQRHIDYPDIQRDAERVLQSLAPVEREVTGVGDRHFIARLLPYRTIEDKIAGVVLTFVDITERQRAEQALASELADTELLRKAGDHLSGDGNMQDVFDAILQAAIALTHADAGIVHLLDDAHQPQLLASSGFSDELRLQLATATGLPPGFAHRALAARKRVVVDLNTPGPGEERDAVRPYVSAGMNFGQATPLIARNGRVLGVLSTLWKDPREPAERELRFLDLLARQAADAIDRKRVADELRQHVEGAKRMHTTSDGWERRVADLTRELNALARRHGEPPPYPEPRSTLTRPLA